MLQAFSLSYSPNPSGDPIFENLDFSLDAGEKVALVGRNGAGKSLLLQLLAGRLTPRSGRVVADKSAQIAYLPQDFRLDYDGSLEGLIEEEAPDVPTYQIARTLRRLGISEEQAQQPYRSLSLGERMRAAIAVLLASEPTILLLDEPTNQLDMEARDWLESFLRDSPEAVLFASHDRSLMNAIADRVVELDQGLLTSYTGGWDEMTEAKAANRARQFDAWERHQDEDRRLRNAAEKTLQAAADITKRPSHGKTYSGGATPFYAARQARKDKLAKAILSRVRQARADAPEKPHVGDEIKLTFPTRPLRSEHVLTVRGLGKSFGDRTLYDGLDLTLMKGSRLAILGENGSGKSTLFKLLLGELEPDGGTIEWAADAHIATLSQARDRLDRDQSALKALDPRNADEEQFARLALARLGMRRDMAHRQVGVMSVGERTKVEIVAMLLTGANVLILDEPTNHLDVASLEALESALAEFPGAVLFTSHDHLFVERVATEEVWLD